MKFSSEHWDEKDGRCLLHGATLPCKACFLSPLDRHIKSEDTKKNNVIDITVLRIKMIDGKMNEDAIVNLINELKIQEGGM